ncbi:Putative auto-transporter adhesin, head GIN domain [Apibacter mensalis]|uniref:Putative auto-transporter adhesin, head GIN domain n=1 Tax=Apibacter mensalis TaxID=1586267 RepID=A0A0X3ART3_9FLAO|nr:DUF2807 domain-containing protein [Apibacter mensalis]CVK16775.1 Putative auto-transporter adhesin, head GIN domain [Apibacter mensalis]
MKKLFHYSVLSVLSILLLSCSHSIKGEGEITNKEIKISPIKEISANGTFRLIYLFDGNNPRIVIESYKNLIQNLKIENSDGKLTLSETNNVKDSDLYNIYIYNPQIEKFDIHNLVNVDINSQLRVSKLTINLYDVSKFLANTIVVDELNVNVNDVAGISLKGTSNALNLTAEDTSNFMAPFLEVSEANIELSDVAKAEINVKSKLTGKISDNSSLTVIGNPAKDIQQKDLAVINFK